MLWPKKNSYNEFDNEKKFLRLENSPPPITFLMVRPLFDPRLTLENEHFVTNFGNWDTLMMGNKKKVFKMFPLYTQKTHFMNLSSFAMFSTSFDIIFWLISQHLA